MKEKVGSEFFRAVLIESDWNLKLLPDFPCHLRLTVLIESDWNLKMVA